MALRRGGGADCLPVVTVQNHPAAVTSVVTCRTKGQDSASICPPLVGVICGEGSKKAHPRRVQGGA